VKDLLPKKLFLCYFNKYLNKMTSIIGSGVQIVGVNRPLRKAFPLQNVKKYYESNECALKFEAIRNFLVKEGEDPTITNKTLASLTYDFLVFQEKTLGIEVGVAGSFISC
jgi:hypothetical protein